MAVMIYVKSIFPQCLENGLNFIKVLYICFCTYKIEILEIRFYFSLIFIRVITQTCLCNILQYFTAVKMIIFR